MSGLPFYIVDVFAEKKYAGNRLAVIRASGTLSDDEMRCIAREVNSTETSFICSDEPNGDGYDLRIFTPEGEVPFAGHPTLGAAYVLHREVIREPMQTITLNLTAGKIPVTLSRNNGHSDVLWMRQIRPLFGRAFRVEQLQPVLGLDHGDFDRRYPIIEVSTGLPFIVVPLQHRVVLQRAHVDRDAYYELIRGTYAKALLLFCPETEQPENDLSVRVFADYHGVPEDPATGSANGCLAGYLARYQYFGENHLRVRVEQGREVGRPSLLYLHARTTEAGIEVYVGGHVVMVARGELV